MAPKSKKPTKSDVAMGARNARQDATPHKSVSDDVATAQSSASEVSDFVAKVKAMAPRQGAGRGRLLFAMDATMSRQPTWDMALAIQSEMFEVVRAVGGLDVQLIYFRGAGECRASTWVSKPDELARLMTTVHCRGGYTQIGKMLSHAIAETERRKIDAVVYVGDCMEEKVDALCERAGVLGLRGVPLFMFQEGHDGVAEAAFREMARLTRGAWCRFDTNAGAQLRELLTAVAVYAAGGQRALQQLQREGHGNGARLLLAQLPPSKS